MKRIFVAFVLISVLSSTGYSQSLLNLIQWPVDEGGNDHWYSVMAGQYYWAYALIAVSVIDAESLRDALARTDSLQTNIIRNEMAYNIKSADSGLNKCWIICHD
ncbi:MAG: hypothetical protein V3V99_15215 [candidate division Zixibacteria bacterium]